MSLRPWPREFLFPSEKDEEIMGMVLVQSLILGIGLKLFFAEAPFLVLDMSLGLSLGAALFLSLDVVPMIKSDLGRGRDKPRLLNMLLVILIWGSLVSVYLMIGNLVIQRGEISLFGSLMFVFVACITHSLVPSVCWNLRKFYRKIRR